MTLKAISRWTVEETPKALGKVLGAQSHAAYHPFDDIAVVAEQSPRLAGVVAMIGSHLPTVKGPSADATLVVLDNEKSGHVVVAKPCSVAALGVEFGGPLSRVSAEPSVVRFSPHFGFRRLAEGFAPRSSFRRVLALLSFGLDVRALRSGPLPSADLLNVLPVILPTFFKVFGPLLRGAICFFHAPQRTCASTTLNHAVT